VSAAVVIEPAAPADVDAVGTALREAFVSARDALDAEQPVLVVMPDGDLLGHGTPAACAQAAALLGLVRALAFEGVKEGWSINAVSRGDAADAELPDLSALSGQLVRLGTAHVGKVWP
jgi:NAD(P)-dependent dehydrogenase (short-subunit alcohol dehydrogenase family)